MSDAPVSHTYPNDIPAAAAPRCRRCKEPIPQGKLDCPACMWKISHAQFMEVQKRYAAGILRNRLELTMVYIAGGNGGARSPLWHLQRFEDIRHAYCSAELKAGNRQDHLYLHQLPTRDKFCPDCRRELEKLLETVPEKSNDVPTDRAEITPVRS